MTFGINLALLHMNFCVSVWACVSGRDFVFVHVYEWRSLGWPEDTLTHPCLLTVLRSGRSTTESSAATTAASNKHPSLLPPALEEVMWRLMKMRGKQERSAFLVWILLEDELFLVLNLKLYQISDVFNVRTSQTLTPPPSFRFLCTYNFQDAIFPLTYIQLSYPFTCAASEEHVGGAEADTAKCHRKGSKQHSPTLQLRRLWSRRSPRWPRLQNRISASTGRDIPDGRDAWVGSGASLPLILHSVTPPPVTGVWHENSPQAKLNCDSITQPSRAAGGCSKLSHRHQTFMTASEAAMDDEAEQMWRCCKKLKAISDVTVGGQSTNKFFISKLCIAFVSKEPEAECLRCWTDYIITEVISISSLGTHNRQFLKLFWNWS